ncbi:hypothetical protein AKJ16_DCAP05522 [Drosera capensis]
MASLAPTSPLVRPRALALASPSIPGHPPRCIISVIHHLTFSPSPQPMELISTVHFWGSPQTLILRLAAADFSLVQQNRRRRSLTRLRPMRTKDLLLVLVQLFPGLKRACRSSSLYSSGCLFSSGHLLGMIRINVEETRETGSDDSMWLLSGVRNDCLMQK